MTYRCSRSKAKQHLGLDLVWVWVLGLPGADPETEGEDILAQLQTRNSQ